MKNFLSGLFVGLVISSIPLVFALSGSFSDVPEGQWYTDAVKNLKAYGIVSGYADGTFGLGKNITREEMAVMLNQTMQYLMEYNHSEAVSVYATLLAGNDLASYVNARTLLPWGGGGVSPVKNFKLTKIFTLQTTNSTGKPIDSISFYAQEGWDENKYTTFFIKSEIGLESTDQVWFGPFYDNVTRLKNEAEALHYVQPNI